MNMTETDPLQVPQDSTCRIGLWGPTASGKTTFLAALRIALEGNRDWLMYGRDDASNSFLRESTTRLTHERRFPEATVDVSSNLSWILRGERVTRQRRLGRGRRTEIVEVALDLVDAPGAMFQASRQVSRPATVSFGDEDDSEEEELTDEERLYRHLSSCDGLIYLFDPTGERARHDSYEYFHGTVLEIAKRTTWESGRKHLPHLLAVCVTKFDHPQVYEPAYREGFVDLSVDERQVPVVHGEDARDLFTMLCGLDPENSAVRLARAIMTHFGEDRTRYFMSSAVGFYVDPKSDIFRHGDYWNVEEYEDQSGAMSSRIRGRVLPVNILEPVLWITEAALARRERRPR